MSCGPKFDLELFSTFLACSIRNQNLSRPLCSVFSIDFFLFWVKLWVKRDQATQNLIRRIQRGQQTFFRQFLMVYSRFCSVSLAFQHSLKTVFPRTPCLSVAVYVVRNRCGICALRSGPAQSQSKKVAKVESLCLKCLQLNRNLR